jgi:glycosyltransferase involved in cell wall biosynthesis
MVDLIDALSLRGVDCRAIVPGEGNLTRMLESRAVCYSVSHFRLWCWKAPLRLWKRVLKKPVSHVLDALRLARVIRDWNCDVVVTNTLTLCEGALAARWLGIPHVTYVREFGDPGYGLNFELGVRLSVRILSMLSKVMVFNSQAVAHHFEREVPASRVRVVYGAVVVQGTPETAAQAPFKRHGETLVCLLVGSILKSKGQVDAVLAVRELARRGLFVRLRIVGGGETAEVDRLRQLIHTLHIGSHVELVGFVPDPYPYFARADVVLLCSHREAFARVTIEAMKMGRPVIAAQGGGTGEQIRDGFNGALYPPGDWIALADRIQTFCSDRKAASDMAVRAQEWATRTFNVERYGADMLAVLKEAAPAPRSLPAATARSHPNQQRRTDTMTSGNRLPSRPLRESSRDRR